ncbi:hypothetical protein [Zavarzinella formosa]|uniref:hypothetical protein n=1 Tax=Zavarzinella formosa TaxID=360055 RepID=UPI000310C83D|nr:hypothetical protein [Zavarzinella formosa]
MRRFISATWLPTLAFSLAVGVFFVMAALYSSQLGERGQWWLTGIFMMVTGTLTPPIWWRIIYHRRKTPGPKDAPFAGATIGGLLGLLYTLGVMADEIWGPFFDGEDPSQEIRFGLLVMLALAGMTMSVFLGFGGAVLGAVIGRTIRLPQQPNKKKDRPTQSAP